jgi:hypothetical protein
MKRAQAGCITVDEPAKAVVGLAAVGEKGGGPHQLLQARAEEHALVEGPIPGDQVVHRRVDAAVAQDAARRALVGKTIPRRCCGIAEGTVRYDRDAGLPCHGRRHADSREDPVVQEPGERLPGYRLDHEREDGVPGIAVAERRPRGEQQAIGTVKQSQHVAIRDASCRRGVEEILVCPEPRGVREEMADRDLATIRGKVGQNVARALLEPEPALVDEQHDPHGREGLGERGEAKVRALGHGRPVLEIGEAVRARERDTAVLDDDHRGPWHAGTAVRSEEPVDRPVLGRRGCPDGSVEPHDPAARHGEHCTGHHPKHDSPSPPPQGQGSGAPERK